VCHDPHIGLSSLFRLLENGPRQKLDVRYEPAGGAVVLQFSGKDALGMPEQTLLFALQELAQKHRFAQPNNCVAHEAASSHAARSLWSALHRNSRGFAGESLYFSTTWHELAKHTLTAPGGSRQQLLKAHLRRLCECVVWEKYKDGDEFQSFLVAMVKGDNQGVHIALNVRLSEAICSERYMPVSLAERLQLSSNTARAVHAFLSVWLRNGERQRIRVDTLAVRLWARATATPLGTIRRQRSDIRKALQMISGLEDWAIADIFADVVTVLRGNPAKAESKPVLPPSSVRVKTGVRVKTCLYANADMSFREREKQPKPNTGAGFETVDASALFLS
jgi:hypothetical protein